MYEDWLYIMPNDYWIVQNITVTIAMFIGIIIGVYLQRWYLGKKLEKAFGNKKIYTDLESYFKEKGYKIEKISKE